MSALRQFWSAKPDVTNQHVNEASEVIRAAAEWANDMHLSISGIRENTSRYLFWTIMLCMITTSLLLLHTLNSLWYQLAELNMHQSTYKQMWLEERAEMAEQLRQETSLRDREFERIARLITDTNWSSQRQQQQRRSTQVDPMSGRPEAHPWPQPPRASPGLNSSGASSLGKEKMWAALRKPGILDDLPPPEFL